MNHNKSVLVLWGEGCDESLAVLWVSRLRAQGQRVYLVGVSGRRNRGRRGVRVAPDVGLSDALKLMAQIGLVIVPCELSVLQRLRDDPRLDQLLVEAGQAGARLGIHPSVREVIAALAPEELFFDLELDTGGATQTSA